MAVKSEVLVIGGGVIGMSCAYELSRRGVQVTVIDKGEMGYGCSYGNAGWITPCFALPLPRPGMLLKSIGWLLDPQSPLYIKPEPSLTLLRWLTGFLFSMNHEKMVASSKALVEISKYSIDEYEKLDRDYPGVIDFNRKGLLMVGQTQAGVDASASEMELVKQFGIEGRLLDERGVRELEPALVGALKGGVYFPREAHGEPLAIVKALTEGAIKNGARVIPGAEVFDVETDGGRVMGVRTTRGWLRADQYVMALGSWSPPLAKRLGINVPILGGKGYALITPTFNPAPKIPLMLVEKKIAVTPRKDSVRFAGTLELVNQDHSITPARVDAIASGARQFFNLPENPEYTEVWRGLRPCTPDGVPIIGRPEKLSNLMVVTGHQMLGLQSAPGSARLAADLLLGVTPAFDPHPFRATRF